QNRELEQLQQIIKDYPYFQNAHLLYLYGLHNVYPEKFNEQLNNSALFLTSRNFLVKTIGQGWPKIERNEIPVEISTDVNLNQDIASTVETPLMVEKPEEITPETNFLHQEANVSGQITENKELTFDDNFTFSLEETISIDSQQNKENQEVVVQAEEGDLLDFELANQKPDH
ncbi:MAG: hypothetical protein HC830_14900, partial [Bacteroidetes bacterium]|nr:hypothetical protein [Bacteroidota bacterium]